MCSVNEKKSVAAQLWFYRKLLEKAIQQRRTRSGKGAVQSWFGKLADQGEQQTGEGGQREKIQISAPGLKDIL